MPSSKDSLLLKLESECNNRTISKEGHSVVANKNWAWVQTLKELLIQIKCMMFRISLSCLVLAKWNIQLRSKETKLIGSLLSKLILIYLSKRQSSLTRLLVVMTMLPTQHKQLMPETWFKTLVIKKSRTVLAAIQMDQTLMTKMLVLWLIQVRSLLNARLFRKMPCVILKLSLSQLPVKKIPSETKSRPVALFSSQRIWLSKKYPGILRIFQSASSVMEKWLIRMDYHARSATELARSIISSLRTYRRS